MTRPQKIYVVLWVMALVVSGVVSNPFSGASMIVVIGGALTLMVLPTIIFSIIWGNIITPRVLAAMGLLAVWSILYFFYRLEKDCWRDYQAPALAQYYELLCQPASEYVANWWHDGGR